LEKIFLAERGGARPFSLTGCAAPSAVKEKPFPPNLLESAIFLPFSSLPYLPGLPLDNFSILTLHGRTCDGLSSFFAGGRF
jgi:hypothetical protein